MRRGTRLVGLLWKGAGYLFGEHGLHKKHVPYGVPYGEATRTPFIVRGPGFRSGSVSSVMVWERLPLLGHLARQRAY